ncbi:protein FAR1-related sequence 5 [Tanacetum coccineum]
MEKQRHVQERMEYMTIDTVPKLKTFLSTERHASNFYNRSLFELVQKDIFVGLWHCQIDTKSMVEGSEVSIIKENPFVYETPKKKNNLNLWIKVLRDVGQLFVRVDILCRHIFCIFKNINVEMIPQQYILRRWTKNLIPATLRNKRNRITKPHVVDVNNPSVGTTKGRRKLLIKGGKEKAVEKRRFKVQEVMAQEEVVVQDEIVVQEK